MSSDPALLSTVSALVGAFIGGQTMPSRGLATNPPGRNDEKQIFGTVDWSW